MEKLLTRDEFREKTFDRDNHKCVVCGEQAIDAHHIIERRLFSDGGYYLSNGASLCEKHHLEAEMTLISPQELRDTIGITKLILPDHLYREYEYDKWGNIMLPNGNRLKGELFFDESVQKILNKGDVLKYFSKYIKYPRTYHIPWSQPDRKDDKYLKDLSYFKDKEIVLTEKMDGENTTMYNDYIHARSIESGSHPSRDYVKSLWGKIGWEIPDGWRICGENLFAKHTIEYNNLTDYFQVFSIWNERNECLSWKDTEEYCKILGLKTVPVLYKGLFDEELIARYTRDFDGLNKEGCVLRVSEAFTYGNFRRSVAKYVGKDFVIPHGHWSKNKIILNKVIQDDKRGTI